MGKKNIALIVAGILILVGIFSATAGGLLHGNFKSIFITSKGIQTSERDEKVMTQELTSFKNIDISIHSGRIELIKSDKNAVEYNLDNAEDIAVCKVVSDTFTFKTNVHFSISLFSFSDTYVKIYYKDDAELENVSLKTLSGKIEANDVTAKTVTINSTSGSQSMSNIKADNIDVKGMSGSIKLANISGDKVNVKGVDGSITMDGVTCKDISVKNISGSIKVSRADMGSATIKGEDGSITIDGITCQDISVNNISGSIKLSGADTGSATIKSEDGSIYVQGAPKGKTQIHNTSGSIKVYSSLLKSEYGYKLSANSGSTRVDDSDFNGCVGEEKANFIDANAMSGSVRFYFDSMGE